MADDPSTTLSSISAPWRLATMALGGIAALALALAVQLFSASSNDFHSKDRELNEKIAVTDKRLDALREAVDRLNIAAAKNEQRLDVGEREREKMKAYESDLGSVLSRRATDVTKLQTQCEACSSRLSAVEQGLREEVAFCRQSVVPLIREVEKEMRQKFKLLGESQ
jgi:chromosome segregation ATPase